MTDRTDHVMVDLETVDNVPTAGSISIGAVVFQGENAGAVFYTAVDMVSSLAAGLTYSDDTLRWWAGQSDAAKAVFNDPKRLTLQEALKQFAGFISDLNDPKVWGNGAAFDNAILATAYRAIGIELPWKFWNDRCYRTVAARIPERRVQNGTHHNALDDAISQADHLLKYAPEAIV